MFTNTIYHIATIKSYILLNTSELNLKINKLQIFHSSLTMMFKHNI